MKRAVLAALVAAAGLIVFDAPARAATADVGVLANAFETGTCPDPAGDNTTTIQVGNSVKWTNCSNTPQNGHNVTADNDAFPTKTLPTNGSSASQLFQTPGTYGYSCTIHGFTGTVIVEGSDPTTTTATAPPTTQVTAPPTTAAATTTTSTTVKPTTTTEDNISGAFDGLPEESTTSTSFDPSAPTTRALGEGGEGTSGGTVALLLVGLIGVGTAVALVMRRMRSAAPPM